MGTGRQRIVQRNGERVHGRLEGEALRADDPVALHQQQAFRGGERREEQQLRGVAGGVRLAIRDQLELAGLGAP